jgi:DUF1365 family protein
MTSSSLYECAVMHHRLSPLRHAFHYRVFMLDVDLDELPALARATRGLSHNRFNLFSIDDRDHLDLGLPGGIRPNLTAWLAGRGIHLPPATRIRLITFPRVLGYGFNPVSFYYLTDTAGAPLAAVAEVTNTFREMKPYLIDQPAPGGGWQSSQAKDFYVSPFSDPGDTFAFHLGSPGNSWSVKIDNLHAGQPVLRSAIAGERRALCSARLWWFACKYPLLSLKIIGLIHWHALRLWLRRVPFFRKADHRDSQRDLLRPHRSISETEP